MSILEAHSVRVLGSGEHVVVFGHGFGTDHSVWKHIVPYLVDEFQVVLYDMMGSGATNPESFSFQRYSTLHGYVDDLLASLDELEIESCIFVGYSVLGMVACLASLENPDAFSKLILLSASPRYLNDQFYFGGSEQEDLQPLFEGRRGRYCSPGVCPNSLQHPARLSVTKIIFQSDCRPILSRVSVPCHILQTQKDLAVPVVVATYLHLSLGGETPIEILPTEGHLPQLSAPNLRAGTEPRRSSSQAPFVSHQRASA